MGSIQSQAQSLSTIKPKKFKGSNFKKGNSSLKDKSKSPPKRLDIETPVKQQPIDDFDSDYGDDNIPDTTEIQRKALESVRGSRK